MPTVRPARIDEIPQVLLLWRTARSPAAVTTDTRDALERLLETDPHALLVAEVDGRIIGTLIAARTAGGATCTASLSTVSGADAASRRL